MAEYLQLHGNNMILYKCFLRMLYKIRQRGFIYIARRIGNIFLTSIYNRKQLLLMYSNLTLTQNPFSKLNNKYNFCICTSQQEINIALREQILSTSGIDEKELIRRFINKHICFVVLDVNNQIVHYSWVCFNNRTFDFSNYCIYIGPDEGYIYNCYTFPDYRGKSIYPWVLYEIQLYLSMRHFKKAYISVNRNNIASKKGITKAGFVLKHIIDFNTFLFFFKYVTISIGKDDLNLHLS